MSMLEEVLEQIGAIDEGWEVQDDDVIICPCGYPIELDGRCPEGCVSPLRDAGFI